MNIRKGKKLVGYDYDITMKWKSKLHSLLSLD